MEAPKSFISLNTKSIIGSNVPTQRQTKQKIQLPDELNAHLQILIQPPKNMNHHILSYYREQYDRRTQMYQLIFDVPLMQVPTTEQNIDNPTPNRMFLHLYITGHYERKMMSSYCRVESVEALIIVFPVFMNEREQARALHHLPFDKHMHTVRKQHSYLNMLSIQQVNRAYNHIVHPEEKGYEKSSKKAKIATSTHLQNMNTYLIDDDKEMIPKGQDRTPLQNLAKLKYFYGPNVKVKELSTYMDILREEQMSFYSWTDMLQSALQRVTEPRYTIFQHLQSKQLESYIRNPHKLAVVAVLPHSHRVFNESIVACVLFEFVPASLISKNNQTKDNRTTLAYISLNDICVDYKYDECILDKNHYSNKKGIRANLLKAAIEYCYKVFGKHNIVFNGGDSTMISFLRYYGFKLRDVMKHKTVIQKMYHSLDMSNPVYVYNTKVLKCSSWDECKRVVADKYPDLSLKKKLMFASKLYGKKTVKSKTQTPRRNHYPVRVSTGAVLLQQYYAHKYLHPYNIQLKSTQNEYEKNMLEPDTKKQIELYCNAIRQHLKRSRKHIELSVEKKNTWKFRPEFTQVIGDSGNKHSHKHNIQESSKLTNSVIYGPEKYILNGLDAETEPGLSLMRMPLGRGTPETLRLS